MPPPDPTTQADTVALFRYGLIADLLQAYDEKRDALFDIVGTPQRDPIRSFADAFKLKR